MAGKDLVAQLARLKEMHLRSSLSYLFKKKQLEIILKILNEDHMTKTEAEYYSRVIKKKLEAITSVNEIAMITLRKRLKRMHKK